MVEAYQGGGMEGEVYRDRALRTQVRRAAKQYYPRENTRNTAARLLYQRQDKTAVAAIKRLARTSRFPQGRMHGLYVLDGLDALDPQRLATALKDPDANVRLHALQLAERAVARRAH